MNDRVIKFEGAEYQVYVKDAAGESVLAEIFKHREYRRAEKVIGAAENPIIDAGAHLGLFAIYARALNPKVLIYSLEPEKNNFAILQNNLARNHLSGIVALNSALAAKTGRGTLLVSPDSHNHRLIGGKARSDGSTAPVSVVAFSDLCDKLSLTAVSLLKMDIEETETDVIESLSANDFLKIHAMIFEYHNRNKNGHKRLERILRENGFSVEIFPSKFEKRLGFIFAVNKRIKK
jgi:FkbM family methyltransferase